MGFIRKNTTILPASGQSALLDAIRKISGKDLKAETEWCIDDEKVNCGTQIKIKVDGKWHEGRFEISDETPYLAPNGMHIKEGIEAEFL